MDYVGLGTMNGQVKVFVKAALNVISMITVPVFALQIPTDPMSLIGWLSLLIGVLLQIIKYYAFEESQSGALTHP